MDIILSGYGKMGKVVEKVALARGHRIAAIIDRPEDREKLQKEDLSKAVAIDFSIPTAVVGNIRYLFDMHVPVVVGTTGWNDQVNTVRQWVHQEGQALFFAANFSIGINLMFELTRMLSHLLSSTEGFEISLEETHHIHKLDAPSGTAIKMAEIILKELTTKERWINHASSNPSDLQIISYREGEIAGIHSVVCESDSDRLVITHEARDRSGFATGAIMAAEWIAGKTGFFGMQDMLNA